MNINYGDGTADYDNTHWIALSCLFCFRVPLNVNGNCYFYCFIFSSYNQLWLYRLSLTVPPEKTPLNELTFLAVFWEKKGQKLLFFSFKRKNFKNFSSLDTTPTWNRMTRKKCPPTSRRRKTKNKNPIITVSSEWLADVFAGWRTRKSKVDTVERTRFSLFCDFGVRFSAGLLSVPVFKATALLSSPKIEAKNTIENTEWYSVCSFAIGKLFISPVESSKLAQKIGESNKGAF